jgi:N-acetylglucosamine repressor
MKKATRQLTKELNLRLVLKTVYDRGEISRADIARVTRLTRTTVSDLVAEWIDQGLLVEVGYGDPAGGKPPMLISVNEDGRQLISVDLSKDVLRGALVNLRGKVCSQVETPALGLSGDEILEAVCSLIDHLQGQASAPLLGIGIATPGLVDTRQGVVRKAVNLGWTNYPLRRLLEARYSIPIYIANDSHIAALAEYTFGNGGQVSNLVVIKVDQGIGSGIVLSGKIHYGDGFGAGEIGHLKVVENGRQCSCGNYGCLETVASTRAVVQAAREYAQADPDSSLAASVASPAEISFDDVRKAFETGDDSVQQIVLAAGKYLGTSIANLIGILDIHTLIISGDLIAFGDPLLEAVQKEIPAKVLSTMAAETEVTFSTLGSEQGILGTSALVLSNELGLP